MTHREPIRGDRARWVSRVLPASLFIGVSVILAATGHGDTTSKVAYVFDFGAGVDDAMFKGSSIFTNAITSSPLPNGGTYNGATFTNVPIGTIDANPATALNGFDTVMLYEVCSIGTHAKALGAINTFLANGGKVVIFDSDRCAPPNVGGAVGPAERFPLPLHHHWPRSTWRKRLLHVLGV